MLIGGLFSCTCICEVLIVIPDLSVSSNELVTLATESSVGADQKG